MSWQRRRSRSSEAQDREVPRAVRRADPAPPSPPPIRPPRLLLRKSRRSVSALQTTRRGRRRRRVGVRTQHLPLGTPAPSYLPCRPPFQLFLFPPSEVCPTCLDSSPMQVPVVGTVLTHSQGTGTERGTGKDTGTDQIITEDRKKVSPVLIFVSSLFLNRMNFQCEAVTLHPGRLGRLPPRHQSYLRPEWPHLL